MPQLDAGALKPEIDVNLPPKRVAGAREDALGPQMVLLPLVVACFQDERQPTGAGLREGPFQAWIAVENAGEHQVGKLLARCGGQSPGGDSVGLAPRVAAPLRD